MYKLVLNLMLLFLVYSCNQHKANLRLFDPLITIPDNLAHEGYEREWGVDAEMYFKKGPEYIHGIQVDRNQILVQYWIIPCGKINSKDDLLKRLDSLEITLLQPPSIIDRFAVLSNHSNIQMMCQSSIDTLRFFYHSPVGIDE